MADQGYRLTIAASTTLSLLLVAAALRFYARAWKLKSLGWDDFTMMGCVIANIICTAWDIQAAQNGLGQHDTELSYEQIVLVRKWSQLAELFNIVAIWLLKISICCFLLRIVRGTQRTLSFFLYGVIVINTAVNLVLFVIWFCQVTPIDALWNIRKPARQMSKKDIVAIAYLSAGFNMATDVICALLPILFLHNIQISARRKAGLLTLTALGLLTCVASILKIIFLDQIVASEDLTYAPLDVFVCAVVEQNVGAFLANLPILPPILSDAYAKVKSVAQIITIGLGKEGNKNHDAGRMLL